MLDTVVVTLHRESKKENAEYRRYALQAFAMVLHELDIDRFTEIYEIVQEILIKVSDKNNDNEEDTVEENRKKKENNVKLQETVYEVLGKAWPSTKETQGCKIIFLGKFYLVKMHFYNMQSILCKLTHDCR